MFNEIYCIYSSPPSFVKAIISIHFLFTKLQRTRSGPLESTSGKGKNSQDARKEADQKESPICEDATDHEILALNEGDTNLEAGAQNEGDIELQAGTRNEHATELQAGTRNDRGTELEAGTQN